MGFLSWSWNTGPDIRVYVCFEVLEKAFACFSRGILWCACTAVAKVNCNFNFLWVEFVGAVKLQRVSASVTSR